MSTAASEMATDRWRRVRLGDAIELAYGKNLPKPQRREGSIPVYGSNGVAGWHDEAFVENSTVIVGRKGSAGAVHLVEGPCFPIDTTYYTRPRAGFEFDVRFLAYALRSLNLERLRTSTGVPGLSREDAYREFLPVPTLPEQRHIADVLSRAENIVRMRREAEQKAKEIIPALFLDMFGDPATNPRGWPVKKFRDLGTLDRGRSRHRPRDASHLYGGPHPFVQTGDVTRSGGAITTYTQTYSDAGLAQSKLWPVGTLCITIAANIAETGVLALEACFPDSVVGFLPGASVRTAYIQHWLGFLQPTLAAQAPQAAQKNINLEILRNLNVPVPPMALQDAFESHASLLRSMGDSQKAAITLGDQAFQSLLAGVFGEAG
jgi:type I restriction enzyme S subunit